MAHSLFEPAPPPFGERLWRRVKELNIGIVPRPKRPRGDTARIAPVLPQQARYLDARGRQKLLETLLETDGTKK